MMEAKKVDAVAKLTQHAPQLSSTLWPKI